MTEVAPDALRLRDELAALDARAARVRGLIVWHENQARQEVIAARAATIVVRLPACSWCGDATRTQCALMRVGECVWRVPGLRVCSLYSERGCRAAWLVGQSPAEFRGL